MSDGTTGSTKPRGLHLAAIVALVLAGLFAYANTFRGEFVWDDASSILLHKHVQDPGSIANLFTEDQHAFGKGEGNFYRPLLSITFMIDFLFAHVPPPPGVEAPAIPVVSPLIFHLTSLFWHVLAAVFLLLALERLGARIELALCVALVFVLHPLQTEAVAYISGRGDSMAAAFIFAGLYFAQGFVDGVKAMRSLVLTCLCFIAGLLSKESASIFPFLLAAVLFLRPNATGQEIPTRQKRLIPIMASVFIVALYGIMRITVLQFAEPGQDEAPALMSRLMDVCMAFALYIKLLFVPTGLHMERTLDGVGSSVAVIGLVLLVAFIGAFIAAYKRKATLPAIGIAWFLLTWLPISGVFPLNAPMAEHWLYVPMAGFWLALFAVVWPVVTGPSLRPVATAVFAIYCAVFLAMTIERNKDWRSNESIYNATLAMNPNSLRVQYNLAVTYSDITDNLPGAVRHYMTVLDFYQAKRDARQKATGETPVWTEELESRVSLGRIYLEAQRYDQAGEQFSMAMSVEPNEKTKQLVAYAAFSRGQCSLAYGRTDRARADFDLAVKLDPTYQAEVNRVLGDAQTSSLLTQ